MTMSLGIAKAAAAFICGAAAIYIVIKRTYERRQAEADTSATE